MIHADINLLYTECALCCALVLVLVWNRVLAASHERVRQSGFLHLLYFSLIFCVADAFWGLIASPTLNLGPAAHIIAAYGFFLTATLGAFVWTRCLTKYLGTNYFRSRAILFAQCIFLSMQAVLLVYNARTGAVFSVTADNVYVPNRLYPHSFSLQIVHFLIFGLFTAWLYLREADAEKKKHLRIVILFSVIPLITGVGQYFFMNMPFYSSGFMLSCLTIFLFDVTQEHADLLVKTREHEAWKKTAQQMLMLRNEFEVVYFVNPLTGEYEMHTSNTAFRDKVLRNALNSNDFFADALDNIDRIIHPDDRKRATEFYSSENMARNLTKQSVVSINLRMLDGDTYGWYCHRAIKSTTPSGTPRYTIDVMNISEAQRAEIEKAQQNAVINCLTDDYLALIYVDFERGKQRLFKQSDILLSAGMPDCADGEYRDNNLAFANRIVYEKDRDYYLLRTGHERIIRRLSASHTYFVDYRAVIDGQVMYLQNKYAAVDDSPNHIIIGITDVSDAKQKEAHQREELELTISMRTNELQEKNRELSRINEGIVELIGDIVESRDENCGDHCRRIKGFTHILAEQVMKDLPEYNLSKEDVELIASASALHDVGKIAIPDAVLLKPGRLTNAEYEEIKTHCIKGCELLKKAPKDWSHAYLKTSQDICRWHHERWDGRGYPDGLKGDEIPIAAQIVSIADCYDALISNRAYHDAYSFERTYNMIVNGECGIFSEKLLACFTRCRAAFELHASAPDRHYGPLHSVVRGRESLVDAHILVVEDDPVSLKLTREILESEGALVSEAPSGDAALQLLLSSDERIFDVILMDLFMDEMDGAEATERIRATGIPWLEDVPIIALSASTDESSIRKCNDSGMSAYLTKPLSVSSLNRILMNYLRSQTESLQQKLSTAERKASKDPLTGLKNITAYTDAVEQLTEEIRLGHRPLFAIVECDINNLKNVNDTFGHDIGDIYIRNCSQIICEVFKRSNVYRIGGDEFVVIVTGKDYVLRDKLIAELETEIARAEKILDVKSGRASLAFGYSIYDPAADESVSQVFKRADISMYVNKRLKRKQFH